MLVIIMKLYKTDKADREKKSFVEESNIRKKYKLSGAQALLQSETEQFKLFLPQFNASATQKDITVFWKIVSSLQLML